DTAIKLEGMPRHASVHAAGVVITRNPVSGYVPLQKGDGINVTQYTMGILEELGLLKMDFLGLRNLTVIDDCQKEVRKFNPDFDIEKIPDDDREVFQMLAKGETEGVFQFESGGMRQLLMQINPTEIEDLIASLSLYRPGPMDQIPTFVENHRNPQKIVYKDERLKPILSKTAGCIIYQEQVMEIFRTLAGFSFGRADLMRRAMSKKKADVMKEEGKHFLYGLTNPDGSLECEGAIRRGVSENTAMEIWHDMSAFASYAFNKSHAAAYSIVAYQTAYLKYHFKELYMAALLSSVADSTVKIREYTGECERLGISVLPPHVNLGKNSFCCHEKRIYMGFGVIKGLGDSMGLAIEEENQIKPFSDFYDFALRLYPKGLRKKNCEGLIKSGALDCFNLTRCGLMESLDDVLESV
ncbi:MAG: DNA polymerase III subunit alpha, partial [Oscillospiraceae bacterium]